MAATRCSQVPAFLRSPARPFSCDPRNPPRTLRDLSPPAPTMAATRCSQVPAFLRSPARPFSCDPRNPPRTLRDLSPPAPALSLPPMPSLTPMPLSVMCTNPKPTLFPPALHIQSKILSSANTIPIFAGKTTTSYISVCTISEPAPSPIVINPQYPLLITGQTVAIVATGCAIAISVYKFLLSQFVVLSLKCRVPLPDAKSFSLDLFYAGSGGKDARPAGISARVATLIKIYAVVLAGRVLLNSIPNIPWGKQPMAALSQVTDPYLHIFQNTAPLVLFSLDVSPIIPFVLLGVLGLLVKLL